MVFWSKSGAPNAHTDGDSGGGDIWWTPGQSYAPPRPIHFPRSISSRHSGIILTRSGVALSCWNRFLSRILQESNNKTTPCFIICLEDFLAKSSVKYIYLLPMAHFWKKNGPEFPLIASVFSRTMLSIQCVVGLTGALNGVTHLIHSDKKLLHHVTDSNLSFFQPETRAKVISWRWNRCTLMPKREPGTTIQCHTSAKHHHRICDLCHSFELIVVWRIANVEQFHFMVSSAQHSSIAVQRSPQRCSLCTLPVFSTLLIKALTVGFANSRIPR